MSSKDALKTLDAKIAAALEAQGLLDDARIGTTVFQGYYLEEFVEQGSGEDAVVGMSRTFDCRAEDLPAILEPDMLVTVEGYGQYRYLRSEHYGNGRVLLLLGSLL